MIVLKGEGCKMLYLHDVWVNWFEGEENGYNVCFYHEWRKQDGIEILDQVPILYISDALYKYIENDLNDLPKALLDVIYKRAYIRKGQVRTILDYAAIVTNGTDIIVFDTAGYNTPIRKSRLIPRQEQLVYSQIENSKIQTFQFNPRHYKKEYHIFSLAPELVHGLTRRERQLKQLMMMALDQLRSTNHLEELRYWLTEWEPEHYPYIRDMNAHTVWQSLYEGLKDGWTIQHEDFCEKLIRGQHFLEKIWELEQTEEQDTLK